MSESHGNFRYKTHKVPVGKPGRDLWNLLFFSYALRTSPVRIHMGMLHKREKSSRFAALRVARAPIQVRTPAMTRPRIPDSRPTAVDHMAEAYRVRPQVTALAREENSGRVSRAICLACSEGRRWTRSARS